MIELIVPGMVRRNQGIVVNIASITVSAPYFKHLSNNFTASGLASPALFVNISSKVHS
jgi:NADP-dependent 3-hydroxy acid dehydrogenase YdfG